jgi:hypothetical protein
MSQKRHTVDQIIAKLRPADVLLGKGTKVPELCKQFEIAEQTYYYWRQQYGGMQPAKELKALKKENARLKKVVTEQTLDMEILKEAPNVDGERPPMCDRKTDIFGNVRFW